MAQFFDVIQSYSSPIILGLLACVTLAAAASTMSRSGRPPGKVAFYLRYSSINQRGDSIDDQRRNIAEHLDRLGIAYDGYEELSDEAVTGMTTKRKGFQQLLEMVKRGEVDLVAVDDLSRLTRGKDLGTLWDTLAAHRCRLISAIDGIDSARESDELGAMIKGVMNNVTNRMNGRRVRRGIAGRVLDGNASYGAHPYGYESVYSNPAEAAAYRGIGPKPKKDVVIKEDEAANILEAFQMYGEKGLSASAIARDFNQRGIPLGTRSNRKGPDGVTRYHTGWTKGRVSTLLRQEKYIGIWKWGEHEHVLDPQGKRLVYRVDPENVLETHRPDLLIVPHELWEKVQTRRALMREKHGFHEGQKKRGAKCSHYSEEYPVRLSSGLIYCGSCGSRLNMTGSESGPGPYYQCPISSSGAKNKGETPCSQRGTVHIARAEKVLVEHLKNHLLSMPDWLDLTYDLTITEVKKIFARSPDRESSIENELAEVDRHLKNLGKAVAEGTGEPLKSLLTLIAQNETRKTALEAELSLLKSRLSTISQIPSKARVKQQLTDMLGIFEENPQEGAIILKRYCGKVKAHSIVAPGKKRGYMELRFTPNGSDLVRTVIASAISAHIPEPTVTSPEREVRIIVPSRNDKLDLLMPVIHELRTQGVHWRDIQKKLKIQRKWASKCYRNWLQAQQEVATPYLPCDSSSPSEA